MIAVWNLFLPEERGERKNVTIKFDGLKGSHYALVSRLDSSHGSLLEAYESMNRPTYPTLAQIKKLRDAARLPPPEKRELRDKEMKLLLPPQGLVLVEVR